MRLHPVAYTTLCVMILQSAAAQRAAVTPSAPQRGVSSEITPLLVVRALQQDMSYAKIPAPPDHPSTLPTANIDVTYIGFPAQAQSAFQYAVDIWENLVASPVTIRVTARWTALDPNLLGSASASSVWRDFGGAPQSGTWYPVALAEALNGGTLNHPDSADINANFNSNQTHWYFGTDGNPGPGQYDMVTVVLHELCHGLGFFGSMSYSGGTGAWGANTNFPFIFDRFTENGSNQQLINTTVFPNPSAALGAQLTSNNVYFDGPSATAANGGIPPKLYCPGTWVVGSSFSHLDAVTFPPGDPNSLMMPSVGTQEVVHSPGQVSLGIFHDCGWTTTTPPPSTVKWEETFSTTTIPPGWRVVDNDGSGNALSYVGGLTSGTDTLRPETGASFWWGSLFDANVNGLIDEWLVSPRISTIESGDSLSFWAGASDEGFDDSLRVFISTTDSLPGSFINQIAYFKPAGPFGTWHQYSFDLSPFAGNDIFVAVNYYIGDGGPSGSNSDNVWIDHFLITTDSSGSGGQDGDLPQQVVLYQNYPNPFNTTTQIPYSLPEVATVRIEIFNTLGERVRVIEAGEQSEGEHSFSFDASALPTGVYLYRLSAAGTLQTRKMTFVK